MQFASWLHGQTCVALLTNATTHQTSIMVECFVLRTMAESGFGREGTFYKH